MLGENHRTRLFFFQVWLIIEEKNNRGFAIHYFLFSSEKDEASENNRRRAPVGDGNASPRRPVHGKQLTNNLTSKETNQLPHLVSRWLSKADRSDGAAPTTPARTPSIPSTKPDMDPRQFFHCDSTGPANCWPAFPRSDATCHVVGGGTAKALPQPPPLPPLPPPRRPPHARATAASLAATAPRSSTSSVEAAASDRASPSSAGTAATPPPSPRALPPAKTASSRA